MNNKKSRVPKKNTRHASPQLEESLFFTIFEQSPISTQILSPTGETLRVNKAWEKLWGVTLDDIKGYNLLQDQQLIDSGAMKYIKKAFEGEIVVQPPIKYEPEKTLGNITEVKYRWTSALLYPVKDAEGNILQVVLQHQDITEQKNAEEALIKSEERFRTLIENSTDAIQIVSEKGEILYTSDSIKNVLGYTAEELKGLGVAPFMHPDDLGYFMEKFQELLENPDKPVMLQYRVKHKDGSWAWLETTGVNHLKTPNINALVGTFRNITKRKETEDVQRANEERLRLALDAGKIGVWDWHMKTNKIEWTDRVYEIHGIDKKAFEGSLESYTQTIDPRDSDRVQNAIADALHQKKPYDIEFRIIIPSGETRWVSTSARVLYDSQGKPERMLGATIDITERKKLEQQKDDFLGIASHELKTPVTSIKAYGQVLQRIFERKGDTKAAEQLKKMDGQINKLTNLISDLLDVTKIQSGRLEFDEELFDFNELVMEVVEELQITTEKHRMLTDLAESVSVFADRDRIGQVLVNFLTNAIKYSPSSDKIIIRSIKNKETITLCVQDFGVGIPEDKQDKVFDQFFRVSGPEQNTFAGLGLGLYVSSEIIKREGGTIWVESIEGEGSTFCFRLPLKKDIIRSRISKRSKRTLQKN